VEKYNCVRASSNLLDALLDDLADRLAERLAVRAGASSPRYADAKHNPLGSARAFLDAARRRDFATFRRGREVVARWADVEAWIESRKRPVQLPPAVPANDDRALLEASGVRLCGARVVK
jgi:hypothetical protein